MVPCRIRQLLGILPRLRGPVVDALESGSSELTTLALCTLELRTEHVALSSLQNAVIDQVVINALLTLIQVMQGLVARTTSSQGLTVRVGNGQTGCRFLLRSTWYRGEIGAVSELASTVWGSGNLAVVF